MNIKTIAQIGAGYIVGDSVGVIINAVMLHRPVWMLVGYGLFLALGLFLSWKSIRAEVQMINVPADATFAGARLQIENPDGSVESTTRII